MKKLLLSFLTISATVLSTQAQISITNIGTPYTQNFDGMPAGASNTFHIMPITGWGIWEKGANGNDSIRINAGGNNAGDTYNFGTDAAADRAIGSIASGNNTPSFGCSFVNNTGSAIGELSMAFVVEMWRSGDTTAGNRDTTLFEYSLNANGLSDTMATWTNISALNMLTPNLVIATSGALDGNLAANKANVNGTFNVSLANGATIWIRWRDINKAGSDDGLAIDDLSVNFIPLNNDKPIISSLSPADGTANVPVSTASLSVTFDRPITVGATGLCMVLNITDGTSQMLTNAQATASGNIATITGVNLLANKEYAVIFDSTLFVSNGFNSYGIYDNTTWNFNTNWATSVNDVQYGLNNMLVFADAQNLNIRFESNTAAKQAQFELVTLNGQILAQLTQTVQNGKNQFNMPIGSLPEGMYLLRCIIDQQRVAKPFVKK